MLTITCFIIMIFLNINCPFHLMSMASPAVAFLEHIYFCPPKGDLTNCHADKNIDNISFFLNDLEYSSNTELTFRIPKKYFSVDDLVEK